jgi:hypothetical protein
MEAVKIGKCGGHPRTRLAALQCGSSRTLHLLAYDGRLTERALHRKLHRFRGIGEWFALAPCLDLVVTWLWLDVAPYGELRGQLCTS